MSSLVAKGKLASHRHHGFWQCMDSLRDRMVLEEHWLTNPPWKIWDRSEEHTSELQSLMRISYAAFCFTKKTDNHLDHDAVVRQSTENQSTMQALIIHSNVI